jgi:hypothetical protein
MLTKTKIALSTLIVIGFASTALAAGANGHKARVNHPVAQSAATSAYASAPRQTATIGTAEQAWMERATSNVAAY